MSKNKWKPWFKVFESMCEPGGVEKTFKKLSNKDKELVAAAITVAKHHPDAPDSFYDKESCAFCKLDRQNCKTCIVPKFFKVEDCRDLYSVFNYTRLTCYVDAPRGLLLKLRAAMYKDAMKLYKHLYNKRVKRGN